MSSKLTESIFVKTCICGLDFFKETIIVFYAYDVNIVWQLFFPSNISWNRIEQPKLLL